jgi:hypothetical protein
VPTKARLLDLYGWQEQVWSSMSRFLSAPASAFATAAIAVFAVFGAPTARAASPPCFAESAACTISGGFTLNAGQSVQAGASTLRMQKDGNLVLYQEAKPFWGSGLPQPAAAAGSAERIDCGKCYAVFQTDGNLVLYDPAHEWDGGHAYWASQTPGNHGATLRLSPKTPLSIANASGDILWAADAEPVVAASPRAEAEQAEAEDADVYDRLMDELWRGNARFEKYRQYADQDRSRQRRALRHRDERWNPDRP